MFRRAAISGLAAVTFSAGALGAGEEPAPFPKFEAKRMKAPGAISALRPDMSNRRIKVQIDPDEQAVILAARPKPEKPTPDGGDAADAAGKPAKTGAYAWYWDHVSPGFDNAGPDRLTAALRALNSNDGVRAPRLQTLQNIAQAQGVPILKSTIGTSVSPALVLAVIAVESAGKADAVSGAGAAGLMQLMPDTATRFGVSDRLVPEDNIRGGVKYLDWLMQEFGNDPILVLAGYNAGEGAVKKHKGVPPYRETRDYVPKVLAAFQIARSLCSTPPELISDGCALVTAN